MPRPIDARGVLVITVLAGTMAAGPNAPAAGSTSMHELTRAVAQLPVEGAMPSFAGATGWIDSPPLTPAGLRGKVVLVEFWTYTCINWRRQLPYVRAWAARYAKDGLVVIGVHTPEFGFEREAANVRAAVREIGVPFPVVIDSDREIWNAFANSYWPALYFVDSRGRIRHHQFGEGDYDRSERVLQQLLAEAGKPDAAHDLVADEGTGAEAAADWGSLNSQENYVGASRTEHFASPGGAHPGRAHGYSVPARLSLNHWALAGDWTMGLEAITSNAPGGRIAYRFHARDLHLVMGPAVRGAAVRFRVRLNGHPPGAAHGADIDAAGNGKLTEPRMYQLIRQSAPILERDFEIEFLEPGVQAFSFTFG
jgi:thiol-disulfide isomerase/thioredoxin